MRLPGPRLLDAGRERRLARLQQPLRLRGDLADRERAGGVGDEAVERDADVDREDVALLSSYGAGDPWTTIAFGESRSRPGSPCSLNVARRPASG